MKTPSHLDCCTHVGQYGELQFLKSRMFDVNMRLFNSCEGYREVVLAACKHILWCAQTEKDGYPKPLGWSGANAGIPWNIIALADGRIMINPKIEFFENPFTAQSNCGSLTLRYPVEVKRHKYIQVVYFETSGIKKR